MSILAELFGFRITCGETLSVNLAQRTDEGVSVLVADFAILVAVAIVETGLAHAALHCAHSPTASSRLNQMATNARSQPKPGHFMQRLASVFGNVVPHQKPGYVIAQSSSPS